VVLGGIFDLVFKKPGHYLEKIFKGTIKVVQLVAEALKPGLAVLCPFFPILYLLVYFVYLFELGFYFGFEKIEFDPLHFTPSILSLSLICSTLSLPSFHYRTLFIPVTTGNNCRVKN
jgi:hypothetical protein